MISSLNVSSLLLGAFGLPGGGEWIVLLILGLLIFGRRLPEVGRSIGRSIVEFKRGIKGIENEVDEEARKPSRPAPRLPQDEEEPKLPEGEQWRELPKAEKTEQRGRADQ